MQADFFLPADLVERAFQTVFERLDDAARQTPADAAEYRRNILRLYARQRGAFDRARAMFRAGLYPLPLADHVWLMPSETGPAVVHIVRRVQLPGSAAWVWQCGRTCKCRSRFHKHTAYLRAIEVALELLDQEDDGDAAARLGRRIANARSRSQAA